MKSKAEREFDELSKGLKKYAYKEELKQHIQIGTFIIFDYGVPGYESLNNDILGRIYRIEKKGISMNAEYGFMFTTWNNIKYIYIDKSIHVDVPLTNDQQMQVKAFEKVLEKVKEEADGYLLKLAFPTGKKLSVSYEDLHRNYSVKALKISYVDKVMNFIISVDKKVSLIIESNYGNNCVVKFNDEGLMTSEMKSILNKLSFIKKEISANLKMINVHKKKMNHK